MEKGRKSIEKRRPKIKAEICDYIAQGANFKEACKAVEISEVTFYDWQRKDAQFVTDVNTALLAQNNKIRALARNSLMMMVQVQEYDEVKTESDVSLDKDNKEVITVVKRTVTTKKIMPNAQLIQYALNNFESETFNDRHDLTSGGESLNGYLELYKAALNNG